MNEQDADCRLPLEDAELLRASEERYRRLVEQAPDAIFVHQHGVLVYANDAAVKIFGGSSQQDILGRQILDFVHPRFRPKVRARIERVMQGQNVPILRQQAVRLDGSVAHVEVTAMPCTYEGQPSVQGIARDVTERKRAQRQVRKQREILRKFFDGIPLLVVLFDRQGRIKLVNQNWQHVLGPARGRVLSDVLRKCVASSDDHDPVFEHIATGQSGWRDFRLRSLGGSLLDVSWTSIALSDGSRIGIGQDITQRKANEEKLLRHKADLEDSVVLRTAELSRKNDELRLENSERRKAEQQLQAKQRFLEQTLASHERQRQLVAYEIHDTYLQDVIASLMYIDTLHDNRSLKDADRERLDEARRLLRKSIDEARRMISGLRPPIIDEQGIVAALEYLVSEFNARGMEIELQVQTTVGRLPGVLESAVFRIVQEALTNLERHSGSRYGEVRIKESNGTIHLEIRDSGIGFDPDQVGDGHFGLMGIKERVRVVGGSVAVTSAPGKGTEIVADFPAISQNSVAFQPSG